MRNLLRNAFLLLIIIAFGFQNLAAQKPDFVVAKDGSGDFIKVQEAIMAVPDFRKSETTIYIKNGVYNEKLILPASKTNVRFFGEDVEKTVLTHDDYASKKNVFGEEMGTTGSTSFYVFGDGFKAKNITFENSAGPVGQAVAVRVDGDRVMFENCPFHTLFRIRSTRTEKAAGSITKTAISRALPILSLDGQRLSLRTARYLPKKAATTLPLPQQRKALPMALFS